MQNLYGESKMMILEFKNSALALLGLLAISVLAAPPNSSSNSSSVNSVVLAMPNGSKAIQPASKTQMQQSAKKLDEKNADWLDMNLRSVSGKNMTLRQRFQTHTKPIFVVLSATWCPPCMHELPFLASMKKTLADTLDVFIVFVDEIMNSDQKNPQLKPSLQKFNHPPYSLPMYYASHASEVMTKKGLGSLPYFLLFSPSGSILHTYTGAKQWDNASVQSELLSHIKETAVSKGSTKNAVQKSPQNGPAQ
jgi:thiol-disulfide isomerase/thioredoxin